MEHDQSSEVTPSLRLRESMGEGQYPGLEVAQEAFLEEEALWYCWLW